ncbi:hypothetical protein QTP86_008962 [Hemibagrus guttatus]|nr:hypothetical protein QTP86_008962 [Hemibagrus guttatus]
MKMEIKEASPEPQCGFHGVLRYRRESNWRQVNLLPPSASDYTVWCEFCGAKAKPPLDFSKTPNPEDFCCAQYMELFKKVEQQWHSLQEHSGESSQELDSGEEKVPEQRDQARPQDMLQRVAEESLRKAKRPSSANQSEMPGCKVTSSGLFTTITFRLSDFVRLRERERLTARVDSTDEEKLRAPRLGSARSSLPAGFGLCHYQGHVQKFYSNGSKFLTTLPDGTAQVFYPSGNPAIIAFIDDTVGVCVVLDDVRSSCPIRAFFQSSGMAACYHSNGSTCLHMDLLGGRSLKEDASRRSQWKWTDQGNNPTPFKPVHLSLNKNIGVRVRGRESVVVTFLASGQHARFSVGSCTKSSEPVPVLRKEDLMLCKEDLMLQVNQLNARLALERLRWCLALHSDARRQRLRLPSALVSQGRRLLRLSSGMCMEEKDKAYIQHCLRDCQ